MSLRKLRNSRTGVVVRVDERTATRMGVEWVSDGQEVAAEVADSQQGSDEDDVSDGQEVAAEVASRPHNGASRKEWAAYAKTLGIDPGTLNRGELIAAVEALG